MALRTLLKFRNLDLTKDINDRYSKLFTAGVFDGGSVVPVVGQMKIDLIAPWKIISKDGMVVEETSDNTRITTPPGQITVIAVKAIYRENDVPIIEIVGLEISAFNLLSDKENYVIFAHVEVPVGSVTILSSYIKYSPRNTIDKIGRNVVRGVVSNAGSLPAAKDNIPGDVWSVSDGLGGTPHLYGWDGAQWIVLTDAATAIAQLTTHRLNLYPDEKHLTDNEKLALVGTSGTALSNTNRVVDNADTRIPSQSENDALQGSDGSPSTSNKYITEAYPWAIPDEKLISTAPISGAIEILSSEGPIFVGRGGGGSADQYFKFYDTNYNREYTTSTQLKVNVSGVYLDAGLTMVIDPSIDPNTDSDGFYKNNSLYIKYDLAPDTGLRLVYGKKHIMKTMPVDAFLRRSPNDGQTSADTITTVEYIKGRDWDDTPPNNETNIELRKDIVDLKEYVSSVFRADHVIGDFSKVQNVSDFNNDFITNVGIPENYSYENTGLVTFTYDNASGTVTFISPITLGAVVPGHVFIDGAGFEYTITLIPDNQHVVIQKRNGEIPLVITTTVSKSLHGSCKPDNNPRKINLSTLQYIFGRERIGVRELEVVPNEFHHQTRNIAFQIRNPLRSPFFREPRVRFYGGFQNRDAGNRSRVFASNNGNIIVTGFFNQLRLLVDLKSASPVITVKVDGISTGTIDLSRSGLVATLGTEADIQQQSVEVATGLSSLIPHTVEMEIGDATDEFIIYGIDLFTTSDSSINILPGRAFVQSDLYKKDSISTFAPPQISTRTRGLVATRFIDRTLNESTRLTTLTDYDGLSSPAGTAFPGTQNFTVITGLVKFQYYKIGDIVKLITAASEEIKYISSLGPGIGQVTFSDNVTSSGAAMLLHIASTMGDSFDAVQEYNRYTVSELGTRQLTDFSVLFFNASDRVFVAEDGTTAIAGKNIRYVTTGIDGVDTAIELIDATSFLRIRCVASQLDLLTANSTGMVAQFSIDGSVPYSVTIPSGGLSKIIGWSNARYQTHELLINNSAGLRISGIIQSEPTHSTGIEGSLLATQNLIATYDPSISTDGNLIPVGTIGVDTFTMHGVFVNSIGTGTPWNSVIDFNENPYWGRYTSTDQENAYFEYFFLGAGFELEYLAKNDRGKPRLFINNVLATAANFPTGVFRGINSANGEVDMYDASITPIRKKLSVSNLPFGIYTLKVQVQTPAARNVLSTGFSINIGPLYEVSSGKLSYTPSKGFRGKVGVDDFSYGMNWVRDERNFDSGAITKEEIPVYRTIVPEVRAQRVSLANGTTSITVAYSTAFDDDQYSITGTISNIFDGAPHYRPVTITAITASNFTVKWNDPIDSDNYFLNYTAIKFL